MNIREYTPRHAKIAANFQLELQNLLNSKRNLSGDKEVYNYLSERSNSLLRDISRSTKSREQRIRLQRKIHRLDVETARRTDVGLYTGADFEFPLLLLIEEADNLATRFRACYDITDDQRIFENYELNEPNWILSTIYSFVDPK